ncbi:MAG TPA: hypothetical protein PLM01_10275 [Bacteroidales bacterium]|jgi:hypothetical protein|nr:hypothetical protein [Bacteroidales bacterium]HQJ82883.1 hypothetical protein [Bacteroidales bacterium]
MKNNGIFSVRKLICLSAFFLSTAFLFGQANFSGNWALNDSKSDFGGSQFRFAATSLSVQQAAGVLTVESTMPGRDGGEMKSTSKYKLDGSVSENPMFNSTRKSTVAWSADKSTLTITSTMTFNRDGQSREMKTTETWKLAEGGKVLKIESVRPGRDGEMKTTAAYDKK